MAKALTASEAVARAIELGFEVGKSNWVKDNIFTQPYGPTTFKYVNPRPNIFNPALLFWERTGVRYYVYLTEQNGRSNIRLYRQDDDKNWGEEIANYNKMCAEARKLFMETLEGMERYECEFPRKVREGFRDASYKDENGVCITAWYDPEGNYCTFKDREKYL